MTLQEMRTELERLKEYKESKAYSQSAERMIAQRDEILLDALEIEGDSKMLTFLKRAQGIHLAITSVDREIKSLESRIEHKIKNPSLFDEEENHE